MTVSKVKLFFEAQKDEPLDKSGLKPTEETEVKDNFEFELRDEFKDSKPKTLHLFKSLSQHVQGSFQNFGQEKASDGDRYIPLRGDYPL